jgi:YYY domain-containing protein
MALGSVLAWLALSLSILAVGTPITAALFPRLADRGASVALPLVLTVAFYVSFYLGRVSLWLAVPASIVVVGTGTALAHRRDVAVRWERVVEIGVVFTLAYLFLVFVRSTDPALLATGGEKFLDFGLLKTLLRAETVPPLDFWYAGEPVLYYFGGHLLVSQGIRLLGSAPGVAYNLALSAVYAAYVAAAYGLAGNVAARDGVFERRAALLGAFIVGWASNLFTPIRIALRPLPDGLAEGIARTLDVWTGRFDREGALLTDAEPFSMWDATGVIDGAIHETPLFAFVNGDLHAHMMAPPVTLLLVTTLFAYVRTPASHRRRRLALLFGVVPAVGGALAAINTWSFFATGGLTVLAVVVDRGLWDSLPDGVRSLLGSTPPSRAVVGRLAVALAAGVAAGGLAVLFSLPFWLATVGNRSIGLLPGRSSLPALVVVHGTFLLPVALYLGSLARSRFGLTRRHLAMAGLVTLAGIAVTAELGVAAVGLVVPFLLVAGLLGVPDLEAVRSRLPGEDDRPPAAPGFELVPIAGALGLVLLVEFVYLREHAGAGRFNTVFKTYAQVWALFAVGTAAALGRLLQLAPEVGPTPNWPTVVRVAVATLVLATGCYGGFVVATEVDYGSELDLDGTAWVDRFHADEAAAIDWLDDRRGQPTVLTRPGEAYTWTGAV